VAERAGARWFIALARVGLAAVLRQNGNESEASMLLREVLALSENDAAEGGSSSSSPSGVIPSSWFPRG
jgi:hypothetical protein